MTDTELDTLLRTEFPTLERMCYLNHAALSPWASSAAAAVSAQALENAETGPMNTHLWLRRETALRGLLADMLGAGSDQDIALLANTSDGINTVANGVDWQAGDNLVTPRNEYITNQMAWDAVSKRGVEVRKVAVRGVDDPETALLNAMDARTRLLVLSSVRWDDGFRYSLAPLGQACQASKTLLFVDAIQEFGALEMNVLRDGVDLLAAGSHKWQMGPEGMGVFYSSERARRQLQLSRHGWRMLDHPYQFERADREPSASARRFEPGSPNTLGQCALFAALSLLQKVGVSVVEERIRDNTVRLTGAIEQNPGLQLLSPASAERQSGIVSFISHAQNAASLRRIWSKKGLYCSVRGEGLRLSPHFYQYGEPLSQAVEELSNTD